MTARRPLSSLDETVFDLRTQLEERELARPDVLFLLATGASGASEALDDVDECELAEIDGMPPPWNATTLFTGKLGRLNAWALDDVSGDPREADGEPWVDGLPLWLAADAGAVVCVHASAGSTLDPSALPVGGFALLTDHLNLSGSTPLSGLGESRLGPLFPDQSRLHHVGLRRAALERAQRIGIGASEAIAACTPGPSLETRAERRMLRKVGADVAVQALSAPLIACAHSGLACLAIVLVQSTGDDDEVASLVERAASGAPRLERLLASLTPDLEGAVDVLRAQNPV